MNSVSFIGDAVIKRGDSASLRVVAAKMQRAREIGIESGLFEVPEVLAFDETMGTLTMRRVLRIRGIRQVRLSAGIQNELMERLGMALALIHDRLRLPDDMRILLPPALDQPGSQVFLHGDFSAENVCLTDGKNPQLVLIDWQMSPRYGGYATWGTRYFDVAWFVGNLFRKPVWKYFYEPAATKSVAAFVNSYMHSAGGSAAVEDFCDYHEQFYLHRMNTQEQQLPWVKRALLARGYRSWREFIKSYELKGNHV